MDGPQGLASDTRWETTFPGWVREYWKGGVGLVLSCRLSDGVAESFGKYQLLKKLATGGMAEVFLARQTGIEGFRRLMVVKRILPHLANEPEFVQMFLNEAKIAARLNHPNIAQIYDLGADAGTHYIAMEFIHGEDLGRVMRKAWSTGQWIARPLAIRIIASTCEALYYAHQKTDENGQPLKVVHRDVSPQNILVSFDGSVKVVDFGIAKAADTVSNTRSGAIKGKFAYMAPEQAAGKSLDHRTDIFSVGLVLYELLTGVRPLKRDSELATLQAALECKIEPPSTVAEVPSELDSVVMRALEKEPNDRYRDARELQMALEEFLVAQRWVAGSVQLSELMATLFADRLAEEAKLGRPDPTSQDSMTGMPAVHVPLTDLSDPGQSVKSLEASPARPGLEQVVPTGPMPADERPAPGEVRRSSALVPALKRKSSIEVAVSWEAPPGESPPPSEKSPRRKTEAELRENAFTVQARKTPQPHPSQRPSQERAAEDPDLPISVEHGSGRAPVVSNVPTAPRPPTRELGATRPLAPGSGEFSLQRPAAPATDTERPRAKVPAPPRVTEAELDLALARDAAQTHRKRLFRGGLGLLLLGIPLAAVMVGRKPVMALLLRSANDGQAIYLSVESNQNVRVYVRHRPEENADQPIEELGMTPLHRVRGVHIRDSLILENPALGIRHEETIAFGQPNEHRKISRHFELGYWRPKFLGLGQVEGLGLYVDGFERGKVASGTRIELVEGQHEVEIRGPQLKSPAKMSVTIQAGKTSEGPTLDLRPFLDDQG
jgi:eukaryotic-like serine/threonine-protein kinase